MTELPRQTYKTARDDANEKRIADRFAAWAGRTHLKIGTDPHDEMKAAIDRVLVSDVITAFFEVKGCTYDFEDEELPKGWAVGLDKIEALRKANELHRVPGLMVVEFGCGTLAYFDAAKQPYERLEKFGRKDRNDPADIEVGARFKWSQFKIAESGEQKVAA